jgi:tRNA (guanine10-N2)-methyltransferase
MAILDDILVFAAETLVDNGRLSFWMPTANEEEQQIPAPNHPKLETVANCVQVFNKCKPSNTTTSYPASMFPNESSGSRRLLTYRRIPDAEVSPNAVEAHATRKEVDATGSTANELNPFRRGYFRKFKSESESGTP